MTTKKRPINRKQLDQLTAKATRASEASRRVGHDALALIRRRMQSIVEAFYDIGAALRTLAQPRIYTAMGYRTFDELLRRESIMSRASASDLIRIADNYTREMAIDLGQAKALALVRYVDATPADDLAERLARADAAIGGKPVSRATAAEVSRAARAIRTRRRGPRAQTPEERAAQQAAVALARALGGKRNGIAVTVRARDGAWRLVVHLPTDFAPRVRLTR